jgi:hypothetical protein
MNMNNADGIKIFLTMFLMNLPTLLICLVAGVVILTKWRQGSSGSLWAIAGFGLLLILCFVVPFVQTVLQLWFMHTGASNSRVWALTAFSIVASVLHACIYAILLVAIFAGRSKANAV